ncbi:MAG: ATP-binding protein [Polyangiales bacterium]
MDETCTCGVAPSGPRRRVVLTGGPGAGKTAALEVVRAQFCDHVAVLPEAASVVFGGGFPRGVSAAVRRASQRAIFHVQEQLERWAEDEGTAALTLCDRGLLDGLAYWPGGPDELFADVGRARAALLARYDLVIHLRTPGEAQGYNHRNPLRTEVPAEALRIDARIQEAWEGHPRRLFVESEADFRQKLDRVLAALHDELPACCRAHMARGVSCVERAHGAVR